MVQLEFDWQPTTLFVSGKKMKMKFYFSKYHGTGNDFILIDNRDKKFPQKNSKLIKLLCDRHFGIGADGLMLLQNKKGFDFEMVYFNSDGLTSSMCGNGGRCITAFANECGIITDNALFTAIDGTHVSAIAPNGEVALKMIDVKHVSKNKTGDFVTDTGSPHYIKLVRDVKQVELVKEATAIRFNKKYKQAGINVNFVCLGQNDIQMRTYERGVEGETLSCGTGTVAVALALNSINPRKWKAPLKISTPGGVLAVQFSGDNKASYTNVWLIGPATKTFSGSVEV